MENQEPTLVPVEYNRQAIISQSVVMIQIEEVQKKYMETIQNIEFLPITIFRLKEDLKLHEENRDKEWIKTHTVLIRKQEIQLQRSHTDALYLANKLIGLRKLLNEYGMEVMNLERNI